MPIKKYGDAGDGKVIPEEGDTSKTASKEGWTADDAAALLRELEDDPERG